MANSPEEQGPSPTVPLITFSHPPVEILEAIHTALAASHKSSHPRDRRLHQQTLSILSQLTTTWRSVFLPHLYEHPILTNLNQFYHFLSSLESGTTRPEPLSPSRLARTKAHNWEDCNDPNKRGQGGWGLGGVGWEFSAWTEPQVIKSTGWVPLQQWIVDNVARDATTSSGSDGSSSDIEDTHDDPHPAPPSVVTNALTIPEPTLQGLGTFIKTLDLSALRFVRAPDIKTLSQNLGPRLHALDLSNCVLITDSAAISIIESCHRTLTSIRLTDNPQLTDQTLLTLATQTRTTLKHLHLERLNRVTNEGFNALTRFSRALTTLKVVQMRNVTDKAAVRWAKRREGQLRSLTVARCGIQNDGLVGLARGCKGLKHVTLAVSHAVTEMSLRAFARCCPDLESFAISSTDVREYAIFIDDLIPMLEPLSKLHTLAIYGSVDLTPDDVQRIAKELPQLKTLKCFCWHAMTEEFRDDFNARQPDDGLKLMLDDGT
ncbi:hypothetical protein HK097_009218 [Rhizophlyctis rosea]|uniref:RNI-like protein n=1 Tax=Rhizophlyctis rosea TaxID=64517 RepID=A0AAD5X3E1_9FUNG|nr:hypothetical protein HK097_009218 [Rhizophlyctis rosea]